jgi:hypothetical protein
MRLFEYLKSRSVQILSTVSDTGMPPIEVLIQRKDSVATSMIGLDEVIARVNNFSGTNSVESPRVSEPIFGKNKTNRV